MNSDHVTYIWSVLGILVIPLVDKGMDDMAFKKQVIHSKVKIIIKSSHYSRSMCVYIWMYLYVFVCMCMLVCMSVCGCTCVCACVWYFLNVVSLTHCLNLLSCYIWLFVSCTEVGWDVGCSWMVTSSWFPLQSRDHV